MNGYDLIGLVGIGSLVIGFYYGFESLTYRWLGLERTGQPLPSVVRWTLFVAALIATPIFLGILVLVLMVLVGRGS